MLTDMLKRLRAIDPAMRTEPIPDGAVSMLKRLSQAEFVCFF